MRVYGQYADDESQREPEEYGIMRKIQMDEYEREYQDYVDRYHAQQPFPRERAEFLEEILLKRGKYLDFRFLKD